MISEERPHIEEIKEMNTSCMHCDCLNEVFNAIAQVFDVKLVIYNNVNIAPTVLGKNISFNIVITIGMICVVNSSKFFSVDHVTDPESLKTFEELDQENSNNSISQVLESSKMDKHGREHVLYPYTGPSLIYLRNNVFHNNTLLEHINDLYPICSESLNK